jgi:hypothetical protein
MTNDSKHRQCFVLILLGGRDQISSEFGKQQYERADGFFGVIDTRS